MLQLASDQQDSSSGARRVGGSANARLERRVPCVLVVDDDLSIRETVATVLRDERYIAATAPNGRVALDMMRAGFRPASLLLDLWMPELDGAATIAEMKADPALATVPIVLVTAASDREIREHAPSVDDVLRKPLDLDRLLDVVDRLAASARVW